MTEGTTPNGAGDVPVGRPRATLGGGGRCDVVRSTAERAGATITEVEGSHVIIISQPQAVADAILTAVADVGS